MTRDVLASKFRAMPVWHLALALFLCLMFIFLALRASDEFRWSDWGFGDAQTMLSLKQWDENGWFANYFLFIPQGYAKVVGLFDNSELRHHAHGTCPGSSPRIGPRLWYTHYPAGYLIPYAALFKVGIDGIFPARMLSIIFSITALLLMYRVASEATSPQVGFFSVLFYGLTPTFLGYADTLANQPLDDLLRFGFMLAVIHSTRAETESLRKKWFILAWVMEFSLSLSSFDSVFFIFLWVIGWDILEGKGFRFGRYFIFGLAPSIAHGLQFLQNVWYLGLNDAAIDIKDAFLLKNAADPNYNAGQDRLTVIRDTIVILFRNLYDPGYFVAILALFYGIYSVLLKDRRDSSVPSAGLLIVLFICGMGYVLVLPHGARMPYEARQMIPFVSFLVGGTMWSLACEFRRGLYGNEFAAEEGEGSAKKAGRMAFIFTSLIITAVFWYRFASNEREPVYYIPDEKTDAAFAEMIQSGGRYDLMRYRALRYETILAMELKKIRTQYEPVYFSVNGFQLFWDPKYVPGYPQILPLTEFYAGSRPILCFDTPALLADDLALMLRKTPKRFSPVLVSADPASMDQIMTVLSREGLLSGAPVAYQIMDKYILDLSGAVYGR